MGKLWYAFAMWLSRRFIFKEPEITYEEPLPENEPVMILANHSGAVGPAYAHLYMPGPKKIWLINYVIRKQPSSKFIFHDFYCGKNKKHKKRWKFLAKLSSFLLRPLLLRVPHIEVYHDSRMLDTFRESVDALVDGKNLIVFPECPKPHSSFVNDIYGGFAEIGKLYFGLTGKALKFFPAYVCEDLKKISVGKPVVFNPELPTRQQRNVIREGIRDGIDRLGKLLPEHKPHPFLTEEWYETYGEYVDNPLEYWKLFDE